MTKRISRIIGFILLIVAIGFVAFALLHPEMSFPWSNTVTYILYAVYLIAVVIMLVAPFKKRK